MEIKSHITDYIFYLYHLLSDVIHQHLPRKTIPTLEPNYYRSTMLPVSLFFQPLAIFFRRVLVDLKRVIYR